MSQAEEKASATTPTESNLNRANSFDIKIPAWSELANDPDEYPGFLAPSDYNPKHYLELIEVLGDTLFTQDQDALHKYAVAISKSEQVQVSIRQHAELVLSSCHKFEDNPDMDRKLVVAASNAVSALNYGSISGVLYFQLDWIKDWSHCRIPYANLSMAFLNHCNFDYADLSSATMYMCRINRCSFRHAILSSASVFAGHFGDPGKRLYCGHVAISPDGDTALLCYLSAIEVWNTRTRTLRATLEGHDDSVSTVCFSPDGSVFVSGSFDSTLRVWDVASLDCIAVLKQHVDGINRVAFSPDGKYLASAGEDAKICVWDAQLQFKFHLNHPASVRELAFSPDSSQIASQSAGSGIHIWDLETCEVVKQLQVNSRQSSRFAYTADGQHLIVCTCENEYVKWSIENERISFVARQLIDKYLTLSASGTSIGSFAEIQSYVEIPGVHRNCRIVAAWPWGEQDNRWCLAEYRRGPYESPEMPSGFFLLPMSLFHWCCKLQLHRITAGKLPNEPKTYADLSTCGELLAIPSYDIVQVWALTTRPPCPLNVRVPPEVMSLGHRFHFLPEPEGKLPLILTTSNRRAIIYNLSDSSMTPIRLGGGLGIVSTSSVSPDGSMFAVGMKSAGSDLVEIFCPTSGKKKLQISVDIEPRAITFSRDGTMLGVLSRFGEAVVVSLVKSGQRILQATKRVSTVYESHPEFSFSPDGTTIAIPGPDNVVTIWEVATGELKHILTGHTGSVHVVRYSKDGNSVITGGADLSLRVWDTQTGRCKQVIAGLGRVVRLFLTPDESLLVTVGPYHVCVWDWCGFSSSTGSSEGEPEIQALHLRRTIGMSDYQLITGDLRDALLSEELQATAQQVNLGDQ